MFKKVEGKNWAAVLGFGVGARPNGEGKEWTGWAAGAGKRETGPLRWAELELGSGGLPGGFLFLLFSIFQPHSNYLNSNLNLNSTLALKQINNAPA